jgi:LysM repeat protein
VTSPATWLTRLTGTTHPPGASPPPATTALRRLTASTTVGGMMLVGTPLLMDYVVRPGDTLSEIAQRHDTSVSRLVSGNGLDPSGDRVYAGQTLDIPAAHGRGGRSTSRGAGGVGPDARRMVRYTVKPGDTPSGLAVRFHAWTAELIDMNGSVLRVGEQIKIPVVLAALAEDRKARKAGASAAVSAPGRPRHHSSSGKRGRSGSSTTRPARSSTQRSLERKLAQRADPSRARVRRVIERTARRHGVDPQLALAVSWQEAGWQQHHVSPANAVGAMQVIPSTGRWMSGVVGRRLDLLDLRDNVTAGVVLLKVLTEAAPQRKAVAGYYQGLAAVRSHGMYDDTKRYVANVLYLKRRFERGRYPA